MNKGNFKELLCLLAEHDPIVKRKLYAKKNATYTHHSIQNDVINTMANIVIDTISQEIEDSTFFTLQVDESKDITKREQISIVVRFEKESKPVEELIAITEASEGINANEISVVVLKTLADNCIDVNNCVGQTYDGASVMSGVKNGVAKKIKERAKYAFYTHCFSHGTNLALVDATKHIKAIGDVMETLNSLYNYFSGSVIHAEFDMQQAAERAAGATGGPRVSMTLKRHCDTRWVSRFECCDAVIKSLPAILHTLDYFSQDNEAERRHRAIKALIAVTDAHIGVLLSLYINYSQKSFSGNKNANQSTSRRNSGSE